MEKGKLKIHPQVAQLDSYHLIQSDLSHKRRVKNVFLSIGKQSCEVITGEQVHWQSSAKDMCFRHTWKILPWYGKTYNIATPTTIYNAIIVGGELDLANAYR